MNDITGEEPTQEDNFWLGVAADDLRPDKSLQRITDRVGFIFTNLTLAGTVLAGAGILIGGEAGGHPSPHVLFVLIILVFASAVAALIANLPSIRSEINPSDPDAIRSYYQGAVRWKGWSARIALLFFSAALVLAFVLVIGAAGPSPTAQLSMVWTPAGTGTAGELVAAVNAAGLSEGSAGDTTVTGSGPGGASVLLAHGVSQAGHDGTLTFSADIKTASAFSSVVLSVTVSANGKTIESRSMKLNL